jgi:hypothetical protein
VLKRRPLFFLALITAALALHPAPATAAPSSTGKYYVVSAASGAQRESLYEIAARTLGNGNRSQEIFDLNQGRLQPDGGRLTDPLVLKPGWILVLPHDAQGTGVHTGSPPKVAAPSTAPSPSPFAGPSAAASTKSGSRHPVLLFGAASAAFLLLIIVVLVVPRGRRAGQRAPAPEAPAPVKADGDGAPPPGDPLVEPVARRPEGPTSRAAPPVGISASTGPGAFPTAAGLGASAVPRGPGASSASAGPGTPARPGPPERLAASDWPAAGERRPPGEFPRVGKHPGEGSPGDERRTHRSGPVAPDADRAGAGASADDRVETAQPEVSVSAGEPDEVARRDELGAGGRKLPGDRDGWPAHDDEYSDANDLAPPGEGRDIAEAAKGAEPSPARPESDDKPSPAASGRPSTAPPEEPAPGGLAADLVVDGDRVAVSLVGVSGDGPGIPYAWRSAGQAPPVAGLPVVLGDQDGRRLHLDLGRCPDVLTVTGALADCEKYALHLVHQLLGNGHGVAVVGDGLFGETLPGGCRRVPTLADVRGLNSPGVVVCGRLTGPDVAAARLSRASGGPTPMIIGEVPRSRWSVQVQPA